MCSSSEHTHILRAVNLIFMIVNVETTFFVLKFVISLLKLENNDVIPFFSAT